MTNNFDKFNIINLDILLFFSFILKYIVKDLIYRWESKGKIYMKGKLVNNVNSETLDDDKDTDRRGIEYFKEKLEEKKVVEEKVLEIKENESLLGKKRKLDDISQKYFKKEKPIEEELNEIKELIKISEVEEVKIEDTKTKYGRTSIQVNNKKPSKLSCVFCFELTKRGDLTCDICANHSHMSCAKLKKKLKIWYCPNCMK